MAAPSFDTAANSRRNAIRIRKSSLPTDSVVNTDHSRRYSDVAMILGIGYQNCHCTIQPRGCKRVIMNLLEDSLKYTSRGYVKIMLDATEMDLRMSVMGWD